MLTLSMICICLQRCRLIGVEKCLVAVPLPLPFSLFQLLSVCVCLSPSLPLPAFLFVYPSLFLCLPACLSLPLSLCPITCPSVNLPSFQSETLLVPLFFTLWTHPRFSLSLCLPLYLCRTLSRSPSLLTKLASLAIAACHLPASPPGTPRFAYPTPSLHLSVPLSPSDFLSLCLSSLSANPPSPP